MRFDVLKFEFISADNKRPLFVLISLCKSPARTAKHRLHFIVKHQPHPFPTLVVFLPRRLKFPLASLLIILFESFCRLIFARFGFFPWGFDVRQIAPHLDRSESRKCFAELILQQRSDRSIISSTDWSIMSECTSGREIADDRFVGQTFTSPQKASTVLNRVTFFYSPRGRVLVALLVAHRHF